MQWRMTRPDTVANFQIATVGSQWSDLQSLEQRLNVYLRILEETMMQCGVHSTSLALTYVQKRSTGKT
jgi:hypothetical protein